MEHNYVHIISRMIEPNFSVVKDIKCDGNRFDCTQIPDLCGPGASCVIDKKRKTGNCKCEEGLSGDGINCFHQNGTVAKSEDEVITVTKFNFSPLVILIFYFYSLDVNEQNNPVLRVHTG